MAKPTKFNGGVPCFQFIASSAMPSPRYTLSVKTAAAFWPVTIQSGGTVLLAVVVTTGCLFTIFFPAGFLATCFFIVFFTAFFLALVFWFFTAAAEPFVTLV